GTMAGSMTPRTPSRANTKPARARRKNARRRKSQTPAGMKRDDAAGYRLDRNAGKAGVPHHGGKGLRFRKATDRFDEIAIGVGVARHHAAKARNDIEGIEIIEPVKARHIDHGEFET